MKKKRRRRSRGPVIAIVVFALIVVAVIAAISASSGGSFSAYTIFEAEHPKESAIVSETTDAHFMDAFVSRSVPSLIWGLDNKNRLFSPVASDTELCMIAELTDGETRSQALSLLDSADIDTSRTRADRLFRSLYKDGSDTKCIPSASIWLDKRVNFNENPLESLAKTYHASSFIGKAESGAYQKALASWINKQTGGLIKNGGDGAAFDADMYAALISTLRFENEWLLKFDSGNTSQSVFHTPEGDVTCDFMCNDTYTNVYYEFSQFRALAQSYKDGCTIWYILPNEGITPESLLADDQLKAFLTVQKQAYELKKGTFVLRVPKFDVTYTSDLARSLPELGVTLALDPEAADFSPLSSNGGIYITNIKSSLRIVVDENGTKGGAAAKAELSASDPNAGFVLDRPFMFLISSPDDLPLFVGIINDPTK